MADNCPLCHGEVVESGSRGFDKKDFNCMVCGKFTLSGTACSRVREHFGPGTTQAAILSHTIRKMQRENEWPALTWDDVQRLANENTVPSAAEQSDNFLRWLGDNLRAPGELVNVTFERVKAIVGAITGEGANFIVRSLLDQDLLDAEGHSSHHLRQATVATLTLSLKGWQRYETIRRGASDSRKAFMAMKFGDTTLDSVFRDCFKPAVAQTGFNLVRLDEKPSAGLIDDRLRVEILSSRFLIAELTNDNLGAYWEAGYAEGLGKPVIYTCEKGFFNHAKTHFDTNHHLTVIWDNTGLNEASESLKATIRATLPADAKLTD
jgi:hypothetical protein